MAVTATTAVFGQSAVEMMQVAQPDFRGTARFMSMGGAFTALGGDLSTLTQNPAGVGIYRHSEIAATLDINMQKTKSNSIDGPFSKTKTQAACNNFGYVGTALLGGDGVLQSINWGVTYNRAVQFDRVSRNYAPSTSTSVSNYIASFTNGVLEGDLNFGENYNPYLDSNNDWLSILAYNSFFINPQPGSDSRYSGLYQNGTRGDAQLSLRERGYSDEYSFNFGGNFANVVYWGVGVGVTDMSYTRETYYDESMEGASVYNRAAGGMVTGNAGIALDNYKRLTGSGWKLSLGVIVRPVNELRIGAAIHSPTYWSIDETYQGNTSFRYYDPSLADSEDNPTKGEEETDWAGFAWKMNSPWRFTVGAAAVIGSNFILSVDYERQAYNAMKMKNAYYDGYGYISGYEENADVNNNLKTYCKGSNILRIGAEYRVTPKFSVRAGYNMQTSSVTQQTEDGNVEVYTSGTDPSFNLGKSQSNICFGLGYRFGAFYLDGTYVHHNSKSDLFAYTNFEGGKAPKYELSYNNNSLVFTLGYRF